MSRYAVDTWAKIAQRVTPDYQIEDSENRFFLVDADSAIDAGKKAEELKKTELSHEGIEANGLPSLHRRV